MAEHKHQWVTVAEYDQRTGKRIGRPKKPAKPGERVSLGLRVTAEIKQKLDEAAEANGRSQSQEAELRLEESFKEDFLDPTGLRPMVRNMVYAFYEGAIAAANKRHPAVVSGAAFEDPEVYYQGLRGVLRYLLRTAPPLVGHRSRELLVDFVREFAPGEGFLIRIEDLPGPYARDRLLAELQETEERAATAHVQLKEAEARAVALRQQLDEDWQRNEGNPDAKGPDSG